jgi:hypothetical protein
MFLFEHMFNTALSGIGNVGLMSTILTVAYGILLASLLFSAYEAWAKGGDVRALGVAAIKYLALGLLFSNGGTIYDSIFRSVLDAFDQMAHAMAGAGPGDVFASWLSDIRNTSVNSTTILNLITGAFAGALSAALLLLAMVLYPVAYTIFAVLYSLFGSILYVVGPLVLALMPSMGLGNLARRYAVNFFVFSAWGLLYGIFCRLAFALNINSMAAITSAGNFAGALSGAADEVLLAAASILFSVCILMIPYLAKRIVEGDLGSAMFAVLASAATLAQTAVGIVSGSAGGFGAVSSSGLAEGGGGAAAASSGAPPVAPVAAAVGTSGPSSIASGGGRAPGGPTSGGGGIGNWRSASVPHAVGWLAGAAAAVSVQAGQRFVNAGRNLIARATGAGSGSN